MRLPVPPPKDRSYFQGNTVTCEGILNSSIELSLSLPSSGHFFLQLRSDRPITRKVILVSHILKRPYTEKKKREIKVFELCICKWQRLQQTVGITSV